MMVVAVMFVVVVALAIAVAVVYGLWRAAVCGMRIIERDDGGFVGLKRAVEWV